MTFPFLSRPLSLTESAAIPVLLPRLPPGPAQSSLLCFLSAASWLLVLQVSAQQPGIPLNVTQITLLQCTELSVGHQCSQGKRPFVTSSPSTSQTPPSSSPSSLSCWPLTIPSPRLPQDLCSYCLLLVLSLLSCCLLNIPARPQDLGTRCSGCLK